MPVSTVIAYHRYTGKCEITIDQDQHTLKGSTSDTVYRIVSEADDESHRVMTVKFEPQTDSSSENATPLKKADMIGVLGRLGMVKIEASYEMTGRPSM
jgi:hypothetical protein